MEDIAKEGRGEGGTRGEAKRYGKARKWKLHEEEEEEQEEEEKGSQR